MDLHHSCGGARSICYSANPSECVAGAKTVPQSDCGLDWTGNRFKGECGALFQLLNDRASEVTLARATAVESGLWRNDMHPTSVWAGSMTDDEGALSPIELEIYADTWGILRTQYAWYPVTNFKVSSTLDFDLDTAHEVGPDALDRGIVQRAAAILSTTAVWNRADTRECPKNANVWSIYCAMEKATIPVTAGFQHRRPALEVVRVIVEERSVTRNYQHRLMDYNNDPTTRLSDVESLFAEALARMNDATWLRTHGFVSVTASGTWQPGLVTLRSAAAGTPDES
jgi:hypothetical protein